MTRNETLKILAVIKTAYPEFIRDGDENATVALWQKMLEAHTYEECNKAVTKHIQTCKFAPKISEMLELLRKEHGSPTVSQMRQMIWALLKMHEGEEIPADLLAKAEKYGVPLPPGAITENTAPALPPPEEKAQEPAPERKVSVLSNYELQMMNMEQRSYG